VIGLDTNLLVYAHRAESPWHSQALGRLTELAEGRSALAIPWPCLHEFLAIVTHPRIYAPATPLARAADQVDAWLESPTLSLLAESRDHWPLLAKQLALGRIVGPRVHDARIATLCLAHGVTELWSADRDFSRFPDLRVRNPLLDPRPIERPRH
jgi:toxin-antitoxin system PIN domain toxin